VKAQINKESNGDVGVGTQTPKAKLDVVGPSTGNSYLNYPTLRVSAGSLSGRVAMWLETMNDNPTDFVFRNNGVGRIWLSSRNSARNYCFSIYTNPDGVGAPNYEVLTIRQNGKVGVGTTSPDYKLDVIGTIRAQEVKVDMNGADFVFEEDYNLRPIEEVEQFVKERKHLPEIATAKEMQEKGVNQSEMNQQLLQKIEELTLYMIEQNKVNLKQQQIIEELRMEIKNLKEEK
jgi:hypothetical protein